MNADDCPDASASGYQNAAGQSAHMLTLGVHQKDQTGFLSLPVYVVELLQTVNRIGHELQLKKPAVAEARSVFVFKPGRGSFSVQRSTTLGVGLHHKKPPVDWSLWQPLILALHQAVADKPSKAALP